MPAIILRLQIYLFKVNPPPNPARSTGNAMFQKLVELPRNHKRALMLSMDAVALPVAFWLSLNLRLDFRQLVLTPKEWLVVGVTTALTMILFTRTGLYRAVVRYIGMEAAWAVIKGAVASTIVLVATSFLVSASLPRSVPFIYFVLVLLFVGGGRFLVRQLLHSWRRSVRKRVAIYGAGAAGTQSLMSLLNSPEYQPLLFVDDDSSVQGRVFHGVPVVSREMFAQEIERMSISDLLLAIPSASRPKRKEIIDSISHLPVRIHTIPGIADLVSGKARIEEFRNIEIEDLLGRDSVAPDDALLHANIRGKVVLVTGAGGSIGSELCRQIIRLEPKSLLLLEQSEFALYQIERELEQFHLASANVVQVRPILGTVLDEKLLDTVLETFGVQTIYHAAAYKHVPLVEFNVVAGIRNNLFGTLYLARAAAAQRVETCVLVSTDKAVRPTNIMGASKRFAELVFQALQKNHKHTCFSMVRFGNVLGSSGSVIPLFREQIANGGPVTVTHPDIIRYFMTIPEAAQLVIQAGAMAKGGEVFVLDMGEPVRIADLARNMISLMGCTVKDEEQDGDIEIVYSGLRPGEKLFEELLIGENVTPTQHPRVLRASEFALEWNQLSTYLRDLERLCEHGDGAAIRDMLMRCPIGFSPQSEVEDILWKQAQLLGEEQQLQELPKAEVVQLKDRKELIN